MSLIEGLATLALGILGFVSSYTILALSPYMQLGWTITLFVVDAACWGALYYWGRHLLDDDKEGIS